MKSAKKAGLITIIIVLTMVILILTYTFLPPFVKERGNLYTAWEKGQWHLTNNDYDELLIEYDYVEGNKPNYTATNELDKILREYTDKKEITHEMGDVIPTQDTKPVYNERDLRHLEDKYRQNERQDNTLVIYVLYLNGEWKKREVLGLSYGGTNIVIFMEMIMISAQRSQNIDSGSIESSVLIHEWGHLIGLVGRGYESGHESSEYPHHCTQEAGPCVMAASVEIKGGDRGEDEDPPTDFCELCQEDIEEIRYMNDPWGTAEILTYTAMAGIAAIGTTWAFNIGKNKGGERYHTDDYGYDDGYYNTNEKRYDKDIYENETDDEHGEKTKGGKKYY